MTMPNLFENSAVRRLLESLATQNAPAQGAPQVPPQAPAQGPTAGMLSQGPESVPLETPPSPLGQVPTDDAHTHQSGIRGGLLHLLGADRMAPETAALLTPEQEARAKPGLLRSIAGLPFLQTPKMIQEARADQMLARGEQGRAMRTREAIERQRAQILEAAGEMPGTPEGNAEWHRNVERMVTTAPVPDEEWAKILAPATQGLPQPRANRVVNNVLGPDGKPYIVTYDAEGNEIGRERQFTAPTRVTWRTRTTPDENGFIVQESSDGQIRSTNIRALPGQAGVRQLAGIVARENDLRTTEENDDSLAEALAEVQDNPTAFSLRNILPNAAVQRNPFRSREQRQRDARSLAALENVAGALRHGRFGAALTKNEADRAARIFSEPTSTPDAIKEQLMVLQRALSRHKTNLEAQLRTSMSAPTPATPEMETVTIGGRTFTVPREPR